MTARVWTVALVPRIPPKRWLHRWTPSDVAWRRPHSIIVVPRITCRPISLIGQRSHAIRSSTALPRRRSATMTWRSLALPHGITTTIRSAVVVLRGSAIVSAMWTMVYGTLWDRSLGHTRPRQLRVWPGWQDMCRTANGGGLESVPTVWARRHK